MTIILQHVIHTLSNMFDSTILFLSVCLGALLTAIGYPKEILMFIFILVVADMLTKWFSIVLVNYKKFTFRTFFKAWLDKNLSSRAIKNGIGVKVFVYVPVLYIAHKVGIIPELLYGDLISNSLYTLLVLIEVRSIMENMEDAGYVGVKPFLQFFKRKQEEIVPEFQVDEGVESNDSHRTI